jgi:hypothetical protein
VTSRWQNPQTGASGRKPTQELADAKLLARWSLSRSRAVLLGFLRDGSKNPTLSAKFNPTDSFDFCVICCEPVSLSQFSDLTGFASDSALPYADIAGSDIFAIFTALCAS